MLKQIIGKIFHNNSSLELYTRLKDILNFKSKKVQSSGRI